MTAIIEIKSNGVVEVDIEGQVSENIIISNVGGLSTIFGASDTDFNSLADKDAMFYDDVTKKWINSPAYFEFIKTQNFIGIPDHLSNLQAWLNHIYSSGRVNGLELTDNLDGTINIAAGEAVMRAIDDPHTTLYSVIVDGISNLALTDNQTNFVYAEYDAVTPFIAVTLNPGDINLTTRVPLYVIVREGGHLSLYDVGEDSVDSNASLRKRFFYTEKFVRADGGSIIYDAGTLHIGCTAGEFYFGLTSFTFNAFDTTGADVFEYFSLINGAWVKTDESAVSNAEYNDISIGGSEALVAIGSNKYAVHWVYLIGATTNPHFVIVYSQDFYANLSAAEAAGVPSNVPPSVEGLGILLGRVIVREGVADIVLTESAFTQVFTSSQATSHNDLASLQGGALNEYYHLTSKELAGIREELTVGVNGRFATIAEALDYIATQPTMAVVASSAQVDLTQYENYAPLTTPGVDTLGDVQPGDWLHVSSGDDPSILVNAQYDWHYYRILSAIESATESHPGLLLESCLLGASKPAYTVNVYRATKFHIKLQAGTFDVTGATVPDGYEILISGEGRLTRVDSSGAGMAFPVYGHMEVTNCLMTGAFTGSDTRTVDGGGSGLLDAGFDSIDIHDIWLEGEDAFFMGNHSFQSIRVNNIFMAGFKGHRIYCFLHADYMRISNIFYETVSSMELVEVITHPFRCSTSWVKLVDDCRFKRREDVTLPVGSTHSNFVFYVKAPLAAHPDYVMEFRRTDIIDEGLLIQADNKGVLGIAAFDDSAISARLVFIDCNVVNRASHDYDVVSNVAATIVSTLSIVFINTKGFDQKQITSNFTGGSAPIILYKNADSAAGLAFNTFLVPSAIQAGATVYEPMTANVTMLNISGGDYGMVRHIVFEQDAGGSRTITWSGSAYKVHTNPLGGASQKAVFSFLYDGVHWIQINAPVWS